MVQVVFSGNLRLNVALTFWKRKRTCERVAYLVRTEDPGVGVGCFLDSTAATGRKTIHVTWLFGRLVSSKVTT